MKEQAARTCVLIERSQQYRGKQGLEYFAGVSAETAGSTGLCLHVVTIPPLARAKPHLHENHESAVYVLSGEAGMWYGENLREHVWLRAGDFLYIPANTPHLPYNASESEPCMGLIARTDPNEQESVTLLALRGSGSGGARFTRGRQRKLRIIRSAAWVARASGEEHRRPPNGGS